MDCQPKWDNSLSQLTDVKDVDIKCDNHQQSSLLILLTALCGFTERESTPMERNSLVKNHTLIIAHFDMLQFQLSLHFRVVTRTFT